MCVEVEEVADEEEGKETLIVTVPAISPKVA